MEIWKQFEGNNITHSGAHHLIAIFELRQERGYARVTDVARHLSITSGSASTNLKSLKSKGLVEEDDNRFLNLTEKGKQIVEFVLIRKQIFLDFFKSVLRVGEEQAEIDSCKIEHLISAETTQKLQAFMKGNTKNERKVAA